MNTKLYKQVYALADELVNAVDEDNEAEFKLLYQQLQALCAENEHDSHKNHPVQWETLADFTEDTIEALALYDKAIAYAEAIDAKDYLASIHYAIALLLSEDEDAAIDNRLDKALAAAQRANDYAAKITDAQLQNEIAALLKTLQP